MPKPPSLELWGGLECTVARLRDQFRNQSVETGHHGRLDDLDRIAALGIRTLRYPVIWETVSPHTPERCDWSWHDERLNRLRQLGIRPIAGLLHHGSGPAYTNLLDPDFPRLFADHAAGVARRYPWIDHYTPVNEPLTTARFSALYGHWFPHETNYPAFLAALVAQCHATVLAMAAIRRVNPDAKLVQTDDFGRTFSTPALSYQAEHENERRWLTFDLLCGRVDRSHPWWSMLTWYGVPEATLDVFLAAGCPPDIIGINHYLTSERFLDARLGRYPKHFWGSNGRDNYADVEAVRVPLPGGELGPAARLTEVWERYRRPIAVTEVHHGCTRDEQLRWLSEVWRAAETVRAGGADIRAVTIWSMFGTTDWNTLLTQVHGIYEPGVYDVRGPAPRPTALAHAAASLATAGSFDHPVLDRPGWWRRPTRFYRPVRTKTPGTSPDAPRPLLIVGSGEALEAAYSRIAILRGLDHERLSARDVAHRGALDRAIERYRPWAVIDAGSGMADYVARVCGRHAVKLMCVGPAPLVEGRLGRPYRESDMAPIAAAENGQAPAAARPLVVRTGPLFGPWDTDNFAWRALNDIANGRNPDGGTDLVSPSYLPDLVHVSLDLLIDGEHGAWHLANPGEASWDELGRMLAERAGLTAPAGSGGSVEPLNRALDTERGRLMPPLASALDRFVGECETAWTGTDAFLRVAAE